MEDQYTFETETPTLTNYAGFWRRFAALIIDMLILAVPTYFLAILLGDDPSDRMNTGDAVKIQYFTIYNVVSFLINWLYFSLMESSARQATLGKQAMGIYVCDVYGNRISFLKASLRYFGKILSSLTLLIGYIMAAFTERKQALHDFIANTLVLSRHHV
jgi:uncharacterized RDD family membrane protein YckC